MHEIYAPKYRSPMPHVSPDGKSVAFIEGLMSDEDVVGGDIYVVPTGGGTATNLTPGIKSSPASLSWTSDGQILFGENVDGELGLRQRSRRPAPSRSSGRAKRMSATQFWGNIQASILSADGEQTAVIRQSHSEAPEVWVGPTRQMDEAHLAE